MRRALIAVLCVAIAISTVVSCTRVVELDRRDAGFDAAQVPDGHASDDGGGGDGGDGGTGDGDLGDGGSFPDGGIGDAFVPDAF